MSGVKSYGANRRSGAQSTLERHLEALSVKGFTLVRQALDATATNDLRQALDEVYAVQEKEFGQANLVAINELDLARAPLCYSERFLDLITLPALREIVTALLGDYFCLHLQNGVINRPKTEHHQSSWHRDLPYQNFVISTPLAISAFYCLDPFNAETGATWLLPHSHRVEYLPSEDYLAQNAVQIEAEPGDLLLFDSMVYHRAGTNVSNLIRRGVNNVFTIPLMRQQVSLPDQLQGKHSDDPYLAMVLGYTYRTPTSVSDFRQKRASR